MIYHSTDIDPYGRLITAATTMHRKIPVLACVFDPWRNNDAALLPRDRHITLDNVLGFTTLLKAEEAAGKIQHNDMSS